MPVEPKFEYIEDFNTNWPNDNPDLLAQQAEHTRGVKSAVLGSFPNLGQEAVTGTAKDLNAYVPLGGIIMYSGTFASIPAAWAVCDGTNGTPDLTNRFILGAGTEADIGSTGGEANALIINHDHLAGVLSAASHVHTFQYSGDPSVDFVQTTTIDTGVKGIVNNSWREENVNPSGPLDVTGATDLPTGGEDGFNKNIPPYYVLAFIQRIA